MMVRRCKMLVAWSTKRILRKDLFEGPEHFYNVFLLSTEKHIFWYRTCKVRLDCEKPMDNAIGLDFGSSCFLTKFGFTSQFTWFCAFFIKSVFCFEANLQQDKLQYFWQKRAQKCHRSRQFCGLGCKNNMVAKPLFFGGGGGGQQAPRGPKFAKNRGFLQCFLVLHKSLKGASTRALKRPSWELFGALGLQKMHFTCICIVFFFLQAEKRALLHDLRAWREQPGTQSESKNARIACSFASWGARVKGERVKGWKGERILGWKGRVGQGPWIMGNLKKGGIIL